MAEQQPDKPQPAQPTWQRAVAHLSREGQQWQRDTNSDDVFINSDQPPTADELQRLQESPTNTYTRFFRSGVLENLKVIARTIAPEVQRREGRAVRIGQLACASGEEAWTLAALLEEEKVDATIAGYDINPQVLAKAREAIYNPLSYNERVSARALGVERLFVSLPGYLRPADSLFGRVTFHQHDILQEPLTGAKDSLFDILLVHNLLYHYSDTSRDSIMENALPGLASGGVVSFDGLPVDTIDQTYKHWVNNMAARFGLPVAQHTGSRAPDSIRRYTPETRPQPLPPLIKEENIDAAFYQENLEKLLLQPSPGLSNIHVVINGVAKRIRGTD